MDAVRKNEFWDGISSAIRHNMYRDYGDDKDNWFSLVQQSHPKTAVVR